MLEIRMNQNTALVVHQGVCNFENVEAHIEQVQAAVQPMMHSENPIAIISVVQAESIDRTYQKQMTALAHKLAQYQTFHIAVLKNPAYRIMVRLASLAIGANIVICKSTAEAVSQARKFGFNPDPEWE